MIQDVRSAPQWNRERIRLRRVRFAAPLQPHQDAGPLVHCGCDGPGEGASPNAERIDMPYPVAPPHGLTLRTWISRWALAGSRYRCVVDLVFAHLPLFGSLLPFLLVQAPNDGIRLALIAAVICLFAGARRARIRLQRHQSVAIHGRFWDQLLSSPPPPPITDDLGQDRHAQALRLRMALEGALCVVEDRSKIIASALSLVTLHLLMAWYLDPSAVCLMLIACASMALLAGGLQACRDRLDVQKVIKAKHLSRLQNRLTAHLPPLRQMGQAGSFLADLERTQQDYSAHVFFTRCIISLAVLAPLALAAGWLVGLCINRLPLTIAVLTDLLLLAPGLYNAMHLGVSTARACCGKRSVQAVSCDMPRPSVSNDDHRIKDLSRISLCNIGFSHDDPSHMLFRDVSLSINKGDVIALTGPSGSGKSTFLNILMGLVMPQTGTIAVNDQPYPWTELSGYRARIASVFQDTLIGFSTVRTAIGLNSPHSTTSDILQAADDAKLSEAIAELPMGLETLIVEGGFPHSLMQQVLIAQGLAQNPDLLVLDETFSALDMATAQDIIAAIRRRKITLVFATHRADLAALADRTLQFDSSMNGSSCAFKMAINGKTPPRTV